MRGDVIIGRVRIRRKGGMKKNLHNSFLTRCQNQHLRLAPVVILEVAPLRLRITRRYKTIILILIRPLQIAPHRKDVDVIQRVPNGDDSTVIDAVGGEDVLALTKMREVVAEVDI